MQSAIMSRPLKSVKCSKPSEARDQGNIDRISSLPDEILGHMLSFLPTKAAVGTSILSPRWRCLHMLTDCLSFECPYVAGPKMKKKAHKSGFKKFVNRVLLLHKVSPIKKFDLDCNGPVYDDSYLHAWICAALSKGVKHLRLCFEGQLNALPHRLFNDQTIVKLEIISYIKDFRFPESIDLPSLKVFFLMNVNFVDTHTFDSFIPACPLLEELKIRSCKWPINSDRHVRLSSAVLKRLVIEYCEGWVENLEIDAPNLTYLKYTGANRGERALLLKNADHLVTADLDINFTDDPDLIQSAVALMKAVYLVKELKLMGDYVQYLTCFEDDHMPSYPNLVKLSLGYCLYDTWKYITSWLPNLPRLETLVFEKGLIKPGTREEKWPRNVELVPFSSGVKVIDSYKFLGDTTDLVLLSHLLRNAEVLNNLILNIESDAKTKKQAFQASKKVMMLPSASTCVVQLRDKMLHLMFPTHKGAIHKDIIFELQKRYISA